MKARNPSTGTLDTVYVKALDSMPVGTQIEYTGDTVPTGWEEVNDYSTTEINTGKKWVDGKDIYRSTYTGTTNSTGATAFNTSIDSLVAEGGYATYNSNYQFPVPSSFGTDGKNDVRIIKTQAGTLSFQYGTALYNGAYAVWVEYTKN